MLINFSYVSYSVGILVVYALGAYLNWRTVAMCCIVLPIISFLMIFASPESPMWLIRNGRRQQAAKVLTWFRGNQTAAQEELYDLIRHYEQDLYEQQQQQLIGRETIWTILSRPHVFKPLTLVSVFQVLQVFTGTYLIVFYAVEFTDDLGNAMNSITTAVISALVRLIMTILCCFTFYYMRRRVIYAPAGILCTLSGFGMAFFMLHRITSPNEYDFQIGSALMLIYVASNVGFMVAPGFMIGELLAAKIRGRVSGYVYALSNVTFFVAAKMFPFFKNWFGPHGVFFVFGTSSALATFLICFMLPETKGKTLGDIEDEFHRAGWFRGWTTDRRSDNNGSGLKSDGTTSKIVV